MGSLRGPGACCLGRPVSSFLWGQSFSVPPGCKGSLSQQLPPPSALRPPCCLSRPGAALESPGGGSCQLGPGTDHMQTVTRTGCTGPPTRAAAGPRLGSHLKGLVDPGPTSSWAPLQGSKFITLPALHICIHSAVCKAPLEVDRDRYYW